MDGEGIGSVQADTDAILGTAGWVDGVAEDVNNDLQSLMRQVHNLLDRWRGTAADTHSDAWAEWFNSANNLVGALADDANALRSAAAGYVGTDSHTAGDIANSVGRSADGSRSDV